MSRKIVMAFGLGVAAAAGVDLRQWQKTGFDTFSFKVALERWIIGGVLAAIGAAGVNQ